MTEASVWQFLVERAPELWQKSVEHLLWLMLVPLLLAVAIGVPTGIVITRVPSLRNVVLSVLGMIQPLPSLAVLALLLPLLGIGKPNAIVALTLYALFPIVITTTTGLAGVPAAVTEAADGIGFTGAQRMRLVELPLALPVIVAGVRTAAVWVAGTAVLAGLIGAGGLGDFILRGLSMMNHRLTILGAGSAIALSLLVFYALGLAERLLTRGGSPHRRPDAHRPEIAR